MISSDPVIMAQLKKDGITLDEVSDYHIYPVADNDSPKLSADRLEYTCSNIINYGYASYDDVSRLYNDLYTGKNEEGEDELSFLHDESCAEFALLALKCGRIYSCDEDRLGMEYLARILRQALSAGILDENDLYEGDLSVMSKLEKSPLHRQAAMYRRLYRVEKTGNDDPEGVVIHTKKRYIDPLGPGGRASSANTEFKNDRDAFLDEDYSYALKGVSCE